MTYLHNILNSSPIQSIDPSGNPLITGVTLATVTNIDKLEEGKVKVKFIWRNNKDEIWARIITSEKGKQPEIKVHDVVLVAFEQGLFEKPIILGFFYPHLKNMH